MEIMCPVSFDPSQLILPTRRDIPSPEINLGACFSIISRTETRVYSYGQLLELHTSSLSCLRARGSAGPLRDMIPPTDL